jgi:predicted transposase/invertase (TIGR01784 family)
MAMKNLIRFDWALKHLLRTKSNYKVLEGFLSELLHEDISIVNISERDGNQDNFSDKFNRVDILAKIGKKQLVIIELQSSSEADDFIYILHGESRTMTNYMALGDEYLKAGKIYSVNIAYVDIGHGEDYIYHVQTEFWGIHQNDKLKLSPRQREYFTTKTSGFIFPEYYIIRVDNFDNIVKCALDEWIYYLKNDEIRDEFKAKGLAKAREILRIDHLPENERKAYDRHVETMISEDSVITSATGISCERIEQILKENNITI